MRFLHGWSQLVDDEGCSCKKYILPSICIWYSSATNSRCETASRIFSRYTVGSIYFQLRFWFHEQNAVHGGHPMRKGGLFFTT